MIHCGERKEEETHDRKREKMARRRPERGETKKKIKYDTWARDFWERDGSPVASSAIP
jgi:hypothetical protein